MSESNKMKQTKKENTKQKPKEPSIDYSFRPRSESSETKKPKG